MTTPQLILNNVSYILPDGRAIFTSLYEQFGMNSTGLVGRNGVGKTVLARILAGQIQPTSGRCQRSGLVHYLAQQIVQTASSTVADLAGARSTLDALARIESGSTSIEDFDAVGDQWDMQQRLHNELERNNLDHLEADTPASILSGGEAMRISLIGAMLSEADFLILDEPSNHIDRPNRQALIEQLQRWSRGLIVVSHDRSLLEYMERIVELSSQGLHGYGGNYSFYAEAKSHERQNALENLNERKVERQRQEKLMLDQRERQERRRARGNRQGKEANQSKILLDRQKERSETSSGALRRNQANSQAQLDRQVQVAAQRVEDESQITLQEIPIVQVARRRVAELIEAELPHVTGATRTINLILTGQQRVGVAGPNGCGKSTLLQLLAGRVTPLAGSYKVIPESAYLDQRLENLDEQTSTLQQLQAANSTATESELRTRLAQLGLDAQKIVTPSGLLSGGERLKAALACVLYSEFPPLLLLLDEPSNHLDIPSVQALETMLQSYNGTLVVVSHDDLFLNNLRLTDYLHVNDEGWCLESI